MQPLPKWETWSMHTWAIKTSYFRTQTHQTNDTDLLLGNIQEIKPINMINNRGYVPFVMGIAHLNALLYEK